MSSSSSHSSSSSSWTVWSRTGPHMTVTVADEAIFNKICGHQINIQAGENPHFEAALYTGRFKYDYGKGIVIIKINGDIDYVDSKDGTHRIVHHKGGVYLYCHRTRVDPQQLTVVNVFKIKGGDESDPDWVAYKKALDNEAPWAKISRYKHGRPCALTFDEDGAAYKHTRGDDDLTGPEMAWIAAFAYRSVPVKVFYERLK